MPGIGHLKTNRSILMKRKSYAEDSFALNNLFKSNNDELFRDIEAGRKREKQKTLFQFLTFSPQFWMLAISRNESFKVSKKDFKMD